MPKRPIFFILLAAGLTLPVVAQKHVTPSRPPQQQQPLTADDTTAVDNDPKLAEQRARFDEEMNRELFQIRESVEREALGRMNQRRYDRQPAYDNILEKIGGFSIFVILLSALLWLIRTIMNNRRWTRVATIQTEMHNKLLEKMASNQELLAYMETEAGKRFLESSPFEVERPANPTFPYSRILLSAQAGVVLIMTGVGMIWLQERLPDEAQGLLFFGILLLAPGIGLLVSAFLSYSMAKHFGLMQENQK